MRIRRPARLLRLAQGWTRDAGVSMSSEAAPTAAIAETCPRCGTASGGAPWCPSCGLNLRVRPVEPPSPPATAPPPARSRPSRSPVLWLVLGALALGGAVTAALLLAFRSSGPAVTSPAAPATVVETVAVTQPAAPAAPLVTASAMANVLVAYETAYSNEDVSSLQAIFAPDLVRQNGNDPPEDLSQALATYQKQFDGLTAPQYRLHNMRFRPGRGQGEAAGTYTIVHADGSTSGAIGFGFVVSNGQLLIQRIAITPS